MTLPAHSRAGFVLSTFGLFNSGLHLTYAE